MYCTVDEVLSGLKDDMIDVILGPELIEDDEERREKIAPFAVAAIEDAGAEIDGYIGKRYRTPLANTPAVIRKYAKDIAVYNLASRTGIDEDDRENTIYLRYKQAIDFLLLVAKGTVELDDGSGSGGSGDGSGSGGGDFDLEFSQRIFDRGSMKGW